MAGGDDEVVLGSLITRALSHTGTRGSVLHVAASNGRRGAEVFAVDLSDELARRGRTGTVVGLSSSPEADALSFPTIGRRPLALRTLRALRALMAEHAFTLAHGSSSLPATALAGPGTARRLVYRSIGDPRYWQSSRSRRLRVRALLSRAERVVALFPAAADALIAGGVAKRKVSVIPNGVPATRFPLADPGRRLRARAGLGIDSDERIALFMGNLSVEKGLAELLRAMDPSLSLLVAGTGPDREALETLAHERAPGRVVFLGVHRCPSHLLSAADLVVVPSRTEGMAAVLIEAGMTGVPVVATDVGAAREVVLPGVSGVLVEPGSAAALRAGLREVFESPFDGARARRHCLDHFEIGVVAEAWGGLFDGL